MQIAATMINNGSNDNCAVDTIFHSMCDFYCEHVGPNTVTLTVVDVNGNNAVDEESGFFATGAKSWWSSVTDGAGVDTTKDFVKEIED